MQTELTLFLSTFTTLLAIINPLEALPVFLRLLDGKSEEAHYSTARRSCIYAALLMVFFLVFGNLTLRVFAVPLSMVRMVGGLVLIRIGFSLFMPSPGNDIAGAGGTGRAGGEEDIAFVPLAMPLMFGPGAIATIIGMSALVKEERSVLSVLAIFGAIVATMVATYFVLVSAKRVLRRIGARGIDAATRIVGFFVSAMGMGLIFHGLTDVLQRYGVVPQ